MEATVAAPGDTSVTEAGECELIYVDLDGTLIRSDLLLESALAYLRRHPWHAFNLLIWAARGPAHLKARLAEHFELDASLLPYHSELIDYLRREAANGRRIVLATASNERLAHRVADHLGMFSAVLASSAAHNLKGANKHAAIAAHCGRAPYAYAGNDASDLHIWKHARAAVLVNASASTRTEAKRASAIAIAAEFPAQRASLKTYLRAIRVYQWSKNLLLFVPLVTAHYWGSFDAIRNVLIAFAAFSLCASSIYLVNDLLDLPSDRAHPRKRHRPIAAGAVSIQAAALLSVLLLAAGLGLAALLGPWFLALTALYVAATTAYSFALKTYVLIDVITLAGLYTMRIIAGAAAIAVVPSFWLLAFSMFVFLSLALVKRYSELHMLIGTQRSSTRGRNYETQDLHVVLALGVASGFAAVQVFAMYINSDHITRLYSRPELLWPLCGTILYWIGRMWIKTVRGEMHDDPLLFAARDRGSLIILAVSLAIVFGVSIWS
jgi:4-hydroxybenzoate polyprenyltransferase/phosphoserine phosphatase